MPRTPYSDPDAEEAYQQMAGNSSQPSGYDPVHEQSVAIDAMANEYRGKPNANLRMRELGSMRSSLAKEAKGRK